MNRTSALTQTIVTAFICLLVTGAWSQASCFDPYNGVLSPESSSFVLEAWEFAEGGQPGDTIYSFAGDGLLPTRVFNYPYPEFLELEVFDLVQDTSCLIVLQIVDAACNGLQARDYTTAITTGVQPLSVIDILDPYCAGADPQFKLPSGVMDNIFDVNQLAPGTYEIPVSNNQGARTTFTLTILPAGSCGLDVLTCSDLDIFVSNRPFFLRPEHLVDGLCDDGYQLSVNGDPFRTQLTIIRDTEASISVQVNHPATGTFCDVIVNVVPCQQIGTTCVSDFGIYLDPSLDSMSVGPWDLFDDYCDASDYRYVLRGDTADLPTFYTSEVGSTIDVEVVYADDLTTICTIPVAVSATAGTSCNPIVQAAPLPSLDPAIDQVLHPIDFLDSPCPDLDYLISIEGGTPLDSATIDWASVANPLLINISVVNTSINYPLFLQWDDSCYGDIVCQDTTVVVVPGASVLIPAADLLDQPLCSGIDLIADLDCVKGDTVDLTGFVAGIYPVALSVSADNFCASEITLYKDCGFTCFDTLRVPLSPGEAQTFVASQVVDDPCFVENQACGSNQYVFLIGSDSLIGINVTYEDIDQLGEVTILNTFTLDTCTMYFDVVDRVSLCDDFLCLGGTTLYLEEGDTATVLPLDLLLESCPNRDYFILDGDGVQVDALTVDFADGSELLVTVVDNETAQSCGVLLSLVPFDCHDNFACVDTLTVTIDNDNPVYTIYPEDLAVDTCTEMPYYIFDGAIQLQYTIDQNDTAGFALELGAFDYIDRCETYVNVINDFDCDDFDCFQTLDILVDVDSVLVTAETLLKVFCFDRGYYMTDTLGVVIEPFWVASGDIGGTVVVVDSLAGNSCTVSYTINAVFDCDFACSDLSLPRPGQFEPAEFYLSDVFDTLCAGEYVIANASIQPGPIVNGERLYFVNPSIVTPADVTVSNLSSGRSCTFTLTFTDFDAYIDGTVYMDVDLDCSLDPVAETTTLPNIAVVAQDVVSGDTYTSVSDWSGDYRINVPEGSYTVTALTSDADLWATCLSTMLVDVDADSIVSDIDRVLQPLEDCYYPEVHVTGAFLRRCFETVATVRYSNNGSTTMPGADVTVTLEPFLTLTDSNVPAVDIGGNTYRFDIGDLGPGEGGVLFLTIFTLCDDDVVLGQTQCIRAEMSPVSDCDALDGYMGADLDVTASCDADSVRFTIQNTGLGDMLGSYEYVVIEDEILRTTNTLNLLAGAFTTLSLPITGGTYTLVTSQVVENPFARQISAFSEACVDGSVGMVSTGFANMFPLTDEEPHLDIECLEIRGSFDPNDKNGTPTGISEDRNIAEGLAITYTIRFENIGNDTAFTVRVEDELDDLLDIETIKVLGASTDWELETRGRMLVFHFPGADLTPLAQDTMGAQGYITFSIRPLPTTPRFSQIYNEAAIFFDFNSPIITNETLHTIGLDFGTATTSTPRPTASVKVSPNPARDLVTYEVPSGEVIDAWVLYDLSGQAVLTGTGDEPTISVADIAAGVYMLQLAGQQVNYTAKVVVIEQ